MVIGDDARSEWSVSDVKMELLYRGILHPPVHRGGFVHFSFNFFPELLLTDTWSFLRLHCGIIWYSMNVLALYCVHAMYYAIIL